MVGRVAVNLERVILDGKVGEVNLLGVV